MHARRFATRLSAAKQYCTARAGRRDFVTAREHRCPPISRCSPRRCTQEVLGNGSQRRPIVQRIHRLCWRRADADRTRTANHWHKHRANTDRSRPVRRPNINQPALSAATQPSRLTRSVKPALHASPPRFVNSQQAREHYLTASQSPKWPPRTLLSVIVSLSSVKESSNPTTVQRETL